jgi:phosphatidylglycerophosphate synthase
MPAATIPFATAPRINRSLTASAEQQALHFLASRIPRWVTSDHLTLLGLLAQVAAGASYAVAGKHRMALLAVSLCLVLNWFGDSLDGTVARIRNQQRPRYGFYVDHMVDILGALALMTGLAASGFAHWPVALAMLIAFLVLSAESYLATYTLGRFQLSTGLFGPTEIRLLLILGNFALLRSPYSHIAGHTFLLFDVGGVISTACMFATALTLTARHTAQLFREEPIR